MIEQPKRAAGYVRVSQVGGREGESFLSPDVQREKIETWAAYRGFHLVGWYVDLDRPAKERDVRPEFDRMMADAKAGKFEAVAVYRLTRFARSVSQAAARYADLRDAGVDLVSVTEDFDTSTSSGRLVQNMLFALAEFESQRIGEEWRNVHAARRRRGLAHAPSGIYGYRVNGSEIAAVEDAEARAVRGMYDVRARGGGLGEVQAWLEAEGYTSPRGHRRFAKTTVLAILRNPVYAGMVRQADGELTEGSHPALVTRDTWDRVQATWRQTNVYVRHTGGLLAGLLVCHGCGYRLRAETKSGRYRCPHKDHGEQCPHPVQISKTYVEEYVEGVFLRRFDRRRMPHGGKAKRTRQQATWTGKATRLRTRAAELTRALDQLADRRYVKGTLDEDEYHRQFARYAEERVEVEEQAADLERLASTVQPLERDVLASWPALDLTRKRKALRILIAQIVVKPYTGPPGRARYESPAARLDIGWLQ